MKTILVPTDFSPSANNAAAYAFELALKSRANIKLCNVVGVPAGSIYASQAAWPSEDLDQLMTGSEAELTYLKELLGQHAKDIKDFHPHIDCSSGVGSVIDYIQNLVADNHIELVVMGMSGANLFSRFVLGSNSMELIGKADFPLLLVPKNYTYTPIKKVSFATDLDPGDIDSINILSNFARYYNAEILITHVTANEKESTERIEDFLRIVTSKTNYNKIYYRCIAENEVNQGLKWLTNYGQTEMLVMTHRNSNFFTQCHSHKLALETVVPLMVLPDGYKGSLL